MILTYSCKRIPRVGRGEAGWAGDLPRGATGALPDTGGVNKLQPPHRSPHMDTPTSGLQVQVSSVVTCWSHDPAVMKLDNCK